METLEQTNESVLQPVQHVRLIFALIIMASFLDIIDFSIVQVALPTIRTQFLATYADLQWVIGAYGLTLAGFLMLMGRAGDVYGQKKIFIAGIVLFTIASMAGGLAPTLIVLIIFRALQGIGAAMSTVTAFAIFIRIFPEGPQRNKALGVLVAVLSAGFAAGAVAGGALTVAFGWRSVMFVNVPIGIAAALLSQRFLPKTDGSLKNQRLDVPGAITVTLPSAVIFFLVGGWGASRIMNRLGARRTLLMSTSLATVGIALLTVISPQGSYFLVLPGMIVWTLGASIGFPAVNLAAVAGTKPGEEGLASGVVSTSFRIGFPLGLAVLLTIAGAFDPPAAAGVGSYAALEGVVTGFRYALFAAVLLSLLGLALASRIKDVKPPWQK